MLGSDVIIVTAPATIIQNLNYPCICPCEQFSCHDLMQEMKVRSKGEQSLINDCVAKMLFVMCGKADMEQIVDCVEEAIMTTIKLQSVVAIEVTLKLCWPRSIKMRYLTIKERDDLDVSVLGPIFKSWPNQNLVRCNVDVFGNLNLIGVASCMLMLWATSA